MQGQYSWYISGVGDLERDDVLLSLSTSMGAASVSVSATSGGASQPISVSSGAASALVSAPLGAFSPSLPKWLSMSILAALALEVRVVEVLFCIRWKVAAVEGSKEMRCEKRLISGA